MIFIQIASYRDAQLPLTVADAIKKAKHPEQLVFGILDQNLTPLTGLPACCKYYFIESKQSKGVCWARSIANGLYAGEEHFMQIDSHTRFEPDWDETMIKQLEQIKATHPKPVFSCYPNMYWYDDKGVEVYGTKNRTNVSLATKWNGGLIAFAPGHSIDYFKNAMLLSGGFIQVPYDPNLYFSGEEIILTLQAFTRGFDMVHPAICPVYHYYTRPTEPKHWADHADWGQLNEVSMKLVKAAVVGDVPNYFGTARSLDDYETYCGISFKKCTNTDASLKGI